MSSCSQAFGNFRGHPTFQSEIIADDLYGDPETPVNDKTLPNKALKRTGQNGPP